MIGAGRPLRFLGFVLGGWIAVRVLWLWGTGTPLPEAIRQSVPPIVPGLELSVAPKAPPVAQATTRRAPIALAHSATPRSLHTIPAAIEPVTPTYNPRRALLALLARSEFGTVIDMTPQDERVAPPIGPLTPLQQRVSRFSGSMWAIGRRGGGFSATAPQLGGSQAGVRIDYAMTRDVALTGLFTTPAKGIGREAGIGVSWRPKGTPLRVIAEQRFALDSGKGGAALGVSGGGSVALARDFDLAGYAQSGVVWRDRSEPYVDGAVRAAHGVARDGRLRLDLGVGAWGAAQRGVSRVDLGPTVGVFLPVADRAARLTLDWRERVAGNARPGSGPAVSIGADF